MASPSWLDFLRSVTSPSPAVMPRKGFRDPYASAPPPDAMARFGAAMNELPPEPQPPEPRVSMWQGATIDRQRSPYERTLGPGETRTKEELRDMLGEVILAAGPVGIPGIGPHKLPASARANRPAPMTGRPIYEAKILADEIAPPFYSQARKVVEDPKTQGTQTGEAWLRYMQDAKRGVKAEELEFTTLGAMLKAKGGQRVTRDEIKSHLDANEIEVKEVTKGKKFSQSMLNDEAMKEYDKPYDELDASQKSWIDNVFGDAGLEGGAPKFSKYTLPGAKNYREVLLTMPTKPSNKQLSANDVVAQAKVDAAGQGDPWEALGPNGRQRYIDAVHDRFGKKSSDFTSGHWDEPNVLAHLRLSDREVGGKRTLLVEEIQSDWAQKGRKEGFALRSEETAPMDSEYRALVYKNAAAREAGREPEAADVARAQSLEAELLKSDSSKIPQGPFVGDTSKWTALGLKRVLKMAADEGYDSIGIVPGAEQAKRYDLSKHIDTLTVTPLMTKDGLTYEVKGSKTGEPLLNQIVPPDKLSDTIGKELADRAVRESEGKRPVQYEGVDLQVGGEGMKGYYDKIVPETLNKLAKEYGVRVQIEGGKVKAIQGGDAKLDTPIHTLDVPEPMKQQIKKKGFPLYSSNDNLYGLLQGQGRA